MFYNFSKSQTYNYNIYISILSIYHFSWFLKRPSSRKNKIFLCLELHVPWKPCNQIGSLPEMIPQSLQCRRCSGNHFLATKEEKLHQLIGLTLIDHLILNMFIFMYIATDITYYNVQQFHMFMWFLSEFMHDKII